MGKDEKFVACCGTDIGTARRSNQDAVLIKIRQDNGDTGCFAAVCDGVGGLERGDYASRCMRERLERWFLYEYPQIIGRAEADRIILERLRKAVEIQNEVLYEYGRERGIRCATTVSALLLSGRKYYIVHVGDSRIYRLDKSLEQLTQDHSLVARELRQGRITKEEADRDRRKNIIFRSVGGERRVEVLLYHGDAVGKMTFLVCTDGFYHHADESELLELFYRREYKDSGELGAEIKGLIKRLKERGERDNISAAVIQQRD